MAEGLANFGLLNWSIVVVFLVGTAWFGHRLGSGHSGLSGFFLGDRDLPWWAVSLSIIASQTSAITLIAVPGAVFASGGNTGYGQLMLIGFVTGKILMVLLFVKPYFKEVVYSPYEFMARHVGQRASHIARGLFLIGAVLSQGVRLLATALVLSEVTGLSSETCILILGAFSALHCVTGGIKAVIWTDVIQASVFFLGGLFMLFWLTGHLSMGWAEMLTVLDDKAKLTLIDWSTDPAKGFTIWVALCAFPIYELGLNSTDQVVTQRLLCCRDHHEAKKAVLFSCSAVLIAFIMLGVGLGLVLHYHVNPLPADAAERIAEKADRIVPYYVINNLPVGLSGLIIAAIFAAGISTLDSALAALSQTSVMGIYRRHIRKRAAESHYLFAAKIGVVVWGGVLCVLAIAFNTLGGSLLENLFVVPAYVYGPLLGIGLLALMRRGRGLGVLAGTLAAFGAVAILQLNGIHLFWAYPLGTAVLVAVALGVDLALGGRSTPPTRSNP